MRYIKPITASNPRSGTAGASCNSAKELSGFVLSPSPSPFTSFHSVESSGKASLESATLSPSSSVSALSPVPSPSVSTDSAASSGNTSSISRTESSSSSASALSPVPSSSESTDSVESSGKASRVLPNPSRTLWEESN